MREKGGHSERHHGAGQQPGGRDGRGRGTSGGDGHPVAATGVLVVSLALALASLGLFVAGDPTWSENQWYFVVDLADAVVFGVVAWVVLSRRSHPVAWLLALTAVGGGFAALSFEWSSWRMAHPDAPALNPLPSMQQWAWIPGTLSLVVAVPWLVREGPLDRRARAALVAGTALTASILLFRVTDPYPWPDGPTSAPFPIRSEDWVRLGMDLQPWQMGALVALGLLAAADVVRRWRSRPLEERRGLGWLAVGTVPIALSFLPLALPVSWSERLPVALTPILHLTSQLFFPAAVLVAVLRQRMWGLDLVVSRAVLWSLMTAAVVASYVVVVWALSPLLARDRAPEVLATALVAAGFQPARGWLQRRVDRLVRGESANPLRAVGRVGRSLGGAADEVLGGVVASLAASFRLGSAAIEVAGHEDDDAGPGGTDPGPAPVRTVLAQVGDPAGEEVAVPLVNHRGTIGQLVVTARPGERLDGRTRASLDDLAPVVANTVQLAATTRALGRSRRRLADARDEERRALRRELHDGLGPALAGINLGLQAARNQLATDPDLAAELLGRIAAELDGRVEEVRGLARGLLPPALGELGLAPALAELADRYAVTGLDVRLAVDAVEVPHVPPEVANAVYAIVSEAVRNVHRHADARRCEVRLGLDDGLVVSVTDDGAGITPGAPQGIGLTSMRERAEGLGGTFTVTAAGTGATVDGIGDGDRSAGSAGRLGTRVEVRVPRDALAVAG